MFPNDYVFNRLHLQYLFPHNMINLREENTQYIVSNTNIYTIRKGEIYNYGKYREK